MVIILILPSCRDDLVTDSRLAMGTVVSVSVPSRDRDIIPSIFSLIYSIDRELSAFSEDSSIHRVGEMAGVAPVELPDDVYDLVKRSFDAAWETEGIFNPMIGPLTALWGMGTEEARVPEEEEIEAVLPLLDFRRAVLSDDERTVFLPERGMSLDLGGVGKGYAADRIRKLLDESGIDGAIVNLGGNVLAYGSDDGKPWRIGIRSPEDAASVFLSLQIEDETVITSGGYQRYIEEDGIRYHHILDPSTGYPFQSDILSVTVINPSGTLGDILSTYFFAIGSESAIEQAGKLGVRVILYLEDGSVIDSDSLDSQIAVMQE